jgi:branched-chain amino acid transport system ATP-binding protein
MVAREILAGPRAWLRNRDDPVVDHLIEQIGLTRYVDVRADLLPTGVARLLELARALAIEPTLLLLDEPSSGLDEAETESLGALLVELAAEGTAVLMVEHDMDLVFASCHGIHVLEFGRIIASGTAADIRSNPVVQAAYLGTEEIA